MSTTIENNVTKKNLYCPHEKLVQIKQKRTLNKVTPQTFKWNISTTS